MRSKNTQEHIQVHTRQSMYWWRDNSQTLHLCFALSFASILTVYFSLTLTLSNIALHKKCAIAAAAAAAASKHTYMLNCQEIFDCVLCANVVLQPKKKYERNIYLESTHQRTNRKLVKEQEEKNCKKAHYLRRCEAMLTKQTKMDGILFIILFLILFDAKIFFFRLFVLL